MDDTDTDTDRSYYVIRTDCVNEDKGYSFSEWDDRLANPTTRLLMTTARRTWGRFTDSLGVSMDVAKVRFTSMSLTVSLST